MNEQSISDEIRLSTREIRKYLDDKNISDEEFEYRKQYFSLGKTDKPHKAHKHGFFKGAVFGYKTAEQKAQKEIEELTKSLGTYYDLNMKLEQQVVDTENALTEAIDCINDMKCCGNCSWWSGRICTNSEWCIRVEDKNDMCTNDLWIKK